MKLTNLIVNGGKKTRICSLDSIYIKFKAKYKSFCEVRNQGVQRGFQVLIIFWLHKPAQHWENLSNYTLLIYICFYVLYFNNEFKKKREIIIFFQRRQTEAVSHLDSLSLIS
jgi:hypothetical protein